MTQPPTPPYGGGAPPPPYAGPASTPARRRRPSGWWFVLGGALVVTAIVTFVALFAWTLSGFLDTDATLDADGRARTVRLEGDERRMLWLQDGYQQTCEVADDAGGPIATRPVSGEVTRSDGSGDWTGSVTFAPGPGAVEVTCDGEGSVIIGPAPAIGSFVGGLLATILVPLLLGGLGVAVLIVTGVLFATGRPRAE